MMKTRNKNRIAPEFPSAVTLRAALMGPGKKPGRVYFEGGCGMSKGITDRLFECSEQLELLHDVFEYGEADQDLTIGGGARKALSRTIGGIYSDILGVIGEISYPEEAVAEKQPTV